MAKITITLTGLPGMRPKVRAVIAHSLQEAKGFLDEFAPAITAASDRGAINIWRTSTGVYHCMFMRNMHTVDYSKFGLISGAKRWLDDYFPEMEEM